MRKEVEPDSGVIVIRNLVKKFSMEPVLDNISLSAQEGKTTVIIGPSGCGKTVLLKHMIVLERPTAGEVYFRGRRIDNLNERELEKVRTQYGFLFQGSALFDSLNVYENIIFPIRRHHKITNWKEIDELVSEHGPVEFQRKRAYTGEHVRKKLGIGAGQLSWLTKRGKIDKLGEEGGTVYYSAKSVDRLAK